MEFFVILLIVLIALDLVALRWSFDSREQINSAEWERRKEWNGEVPAHHH